MGIHMLQSGKDNESTAYSADGITVVCLDLSDLPESELFLIETFSFHGSYYKLQDTQNLTPTQVRH